MTAAALLGALLGGAMGVFLGFFIAATDRDGIWPNVWAVLILTLAIFGAVVGVIDYSVADVPPELGGE